MCFPSKQTKKEARDYLWDFYLVFSYVFYLFISVIKADVKHICVKPKISLTHINQWYSQHLHDGESYDLSVTHGLWRIMSWKHTSSNHQYREMLINHTGHISLPQEHLHCPWLHKTWERNNNEDFTLYAFYCRWKEHSDILFFLPFVCLHVIQMLFSPCSADYDVHNIAFLSKNPHFFVFTKVSFIYNMILMGFSHLIYIFLVLYFTIHILFPGSN